MTNRPGAANANMPCDARRMRIYPESVHRLAGKTVRLANHGEEDVILADPAVGFGNGVPLAGSAEFCYPLNHENACVLRALFPFTAPMRVLSNERTMGAGDRLGIATPGHIRAFEKFDATPVLAQQSMRELKLTGRGYDNVLDNATFAVFRAGFTRGFGADGDHLKTDEEIEYALQSGYTMITLDCSEYIRNDAVSMSDAEVEAHCVPDETLERIYCGKTFMAEDSALSFPPEQLRRAALIYGAALQRIEEVYHKYILHKNVDFEISIDETDSPTTPLQHYFIANELRRRNIGHETLAPRFCGEFQKGVDYRGDVEQFAREMRIHAAIARCFGYKLSIHSGSDKFSVFPIIGRETKNRYHIKTAGTSWLEAMRVAAMTDAALYREVHAYALESFAEASKYYHVGADLHKIPPLKGLEDGQLSDLFDQDDARQLIHITYGMILNAKDESGAYRFRERLYRLWRENGDAYAHRLEKHMGRHLALLYGTRTGKEDHHG